MNALRIILPHLLFFLLFAGTLQVVAQHAPVLNDTSEIFKFVHSDLDNWIRSEDFQKFKMRHFPEVKGTIVIDLSVSGKGKIETVFNQENTTGNISFVNSFTTLLKKHTFPFKLKKGARYKITHTFTIQP